MVSSRAQLEKILAIRHPDVTPALRHVIAIDQDATGRDVPPSSDVIARGRRRWRSIPAGARTRSRSNPDDLATLIYTSGTTGDPKGVMLSHGNITSNVVTSMSIVQLDAQSDECLSFLPLSHVFERMLGHYCMFHSGVIINYAIERRRGLGRDEGAAAYDRRLGAAVVREDLCPGARGRAGRLRGETQDLLLGQANRGTVGGVHPGAAAGARRPGLQEADRGPPGVLQAEGRDRGTSCRIFVSGGAPLSAEIAKFFYAAGLPILEGYGLTETSPVIAVNTFDHLKLGTVGRPIPGVQVKIASDGEILTRGPHIMKGYYNKPEATNEVIDADGWFHTGDIGLLDADGFLKITDRKKDIIVTAGGKNIAPQPIENRVKANKFVSNAVMIGDKRKFPIMLVVPNMDNLKAWAHAKNLSFADEASLVELASGGRQDRAGDEKGAARPGPLRDAEEGHAAVPRLQYRRRRADADAQGEAESRGAELPGPDRSALCGAGPEVLTTSSGGPPSLFAPPTTRRLPQRLEFRQSRRSALAHDSESGQHAPRRFLLPFRVRIPYHRPVRPRAATGT